jgi:hypothetical protein
MPKTFSAVAPFGETRKKNTQLFFPILEMQKMESSKNSVLPRLGNEIFIELIKTDKKSRYLFVEQHTNINIIRS